MLVYFNDMLSSGYIPDLYTADDTDNIINAIRPEVKAAGLMDSRDNNWNFFIDRVRKDGQVEMHVIRGDVAESDFGKFGNLVFELYYRVDLDTMS